MTFSSPNAFRDFDRSVRRKLRYVREAAQEEFLTDVIASSDARTVVLKAGYILWRAQLGHDWREIQQETESFEVPAAHPPARMKPVPEKATDGRVNPRGIACLYLATKKDTAVLEVRPLIGSYVSVAQFKVMRGPASELHRRAHGQSCPLAPRALDARRDRESRLVGYQRSVFGARGTRRQQRGICADADTC